MKLARRRLRVRMVRVAGDRERLRTTFNSAALLYHRARPDYPEELFDALVRLCDLRPGDRLLEVGCGTGKATLPLARRGFAITCVEMGPELAAEARRNLAGFPDVEIVPSAFETWRPPAGRGYELVFAATSWHWIDPAARYRLAWDLLRPGGHLAFWGASHVFPAGGDPFFREIQDVYDEIGEGPPAGAEYLQPAELPDARDEIRASGLFDQVETRHFDWAISYDADSYIELLETFSGHIAMEPWQRDRLYGEIRRRLARRPGGQLRRHWGAVLHVALARQRGKGAAYAPVARGAGAADARYG
jgi:SAM-dependent methyltransferase